MKDIEEKYWREYLDSKPGDLPESPRVEASYAGNKTSTDKLLELYLIGKKTAGSSIAEDFLANGEPLPQVGNYWIFLNSKDMPSCILKTERVVFNKFKDVPTEIAIAEAEGDLSLEYWRNTHCKFYAPFLEKWGIRHIDEAIVVTEFFKIVYR